MLIANDTQWVFLSNGDGTFTPRGNTHPFWNFGSPPTNSYTPIVGDFKYGGAASRGKGAIADKLHLHARSIDIAHPDSGRLRVTAPLPPHMVHAWRLFGFDPASTIDPFADERRK